MATITETIRGLLASTAWRTSTPYDINCGGCEDFQQDLISTANLDGGDVERCTENYHEASGMPGHCWIFYEGLHYDAETPEGVDDWRRLPIFAKALNKAAQRPTTGGR